jgi:glyoxylase-like metal-dependent hydrolase (beta-lactamase superfamily II)
VPAVRLVLLLLLVQESSTVRPDPPIACGDCAEWNAPREPYRVFGNTYYVGVQGLASVLIASDAGLILLDGGLPQSAPLIDENIRKAGFRTANIRLILNSHAHFDHAGGIAALQRASGAVVAASAAGARAIEQGGPTADDPQYALGGKFPAVTKVRVVSDGEVVRVGNLAVTAHLTPGHTPGSTTWSWRSCEGARCQDVVYADSLNPVSAPKFRFTGDATHPGTSAEFRRSIAKVAALPCDVLLTVHPAFAAGQSCRTYAAGAAKRLDDRIAEERLTPVASGFRRKNESSAQEQPAGRPLTLNAGNPHYFQWRGRPIILISSAEHYGAVMNLDFDSRRYLDTLAADGLNYTRVFSGAYVEPEGAFNITRNTLAPRPGRFIAPWARSTEPGYANTGNKFDLARWDAAYFTRLKDFIADAATRNIVVELTLFCPMYDEMQWKLSPMNAANNVNGVGAVVRTDVYTLDRHGGLLAVQEALTRKIVTELNGFDNLFFEICNEAYFGGVTIPWQHHIAEVIVETERGLGAKHLIAQNIANNSAKVVDPHPAVSIFNFHYAAPPDTVGLNYALNKVIGDDETGFRGITDAPYRTEAWDFVVAGGGLYNNLDYSFVAGQEDGTFVYPASQPGGGNPAFRRQMKILSDFINGFDFVRMSPDNSVIKGGAPPGGSARALVERGKAMAIYVRRETATGPWSARWTGFIEVPSSGEYTFHTFSNDGIRLRVNDAVLIEDWTDHGEKEDAGRITLAAGQRYPVRLEYFYNGGQGVSKLWWTPPGGRKEAVPTSVLRLPAGGRGLRGEYFKGVDLSEAWAQRDDVQIDFAWGVKPPFSGESTGPTALQVELTDGVWQAEWLDTKSGTVVSKSRVEGDGIRMFEAPAYDTDIALRLKRQ